MQSSKAPTFLALSGPEAKVLDYQTQQQKLLPQLATAYAFHFAAHGLLDFFQRSYSAILHRDFSLLPEVPAVCWGAGAGRGAETLRRGPTPVGPFTVSIPGLPVSWGTQGELYPNIEIHPHLAPRKLQKC